MSEEKIIKILIADDSKLTILGLRTTFKQYNEFEIIDCVENGQLAIQAVKELNPDIVLMDIGMPIMDGIQATKEIKKLGLPVKIIMLTSHDNEQDVLDALSVGANSYCMKDIDPQILISVIKSTYSGACWLDPLIANIVLKKLTLGTVDKPVEDKLLTGREIDVLNLIAKGSSNLEISEKLCISMNTVKTHVKNIFQKLEVEDRTQAAMKAFKKDIIKQN